MTFPLFDRDGNRITEGDYIVNNSTGNLCKVVDDESGIDYTIANANQHAPTFHANNGYNFTRVSRADICFLPGESE